MRVLTLEDTMDLLDMPAVLAALEPMYRQMGLGEAGSVRRADLMCRGPLPESWYGLKTMSGLVPSQGVAAIRLNSDVVTWPTVEGSLRRVKVPRAPGARWVGLVLLFSVDTGQPLAIFPDGFVQRMRVGGAGGLSVKHLARPDASVLGLVGAGWQAGSALLAACAVRPIRRVRVYSPREESRRAFAERMSREAGVEVVPVSSAEEACRGADVVSCATNALAHVVQGSWVEPGMHLTCVRPHELAPDAYGRCRRIFVHSRVNEPLHVLLGEAAPLPELDQGWRHPGYESLDWTRQPELAELIAGRAEGRATPEEVTCFNNNIGLGAQFAAVGAALLQRAEAAGRGHVLPDEWFLQDVHP